jgi:cytochrome c
MSKIVFALTAAAVLSLSTSAWADEAEAKKAGCLGACHAMDKQKDGPAYKEVAKKFKGKGEAAILAAYKANKEHADNKATEEQVKKVTGWILTLP